MPKEDTCNLDVDRIVYDGFRHGEIIADIDPDKVRYVRSPYSDEKATKLATQHWGYIRSLLENHDIETVIIEQIGFHYRTAFVHGYKHAMQDRDLSEKAD